MRSIKRRAFDIISSPLNSSWSVSTKRPFGWRRSYNDISLGWYSSTFQIGSSTSFWLNRSTVSRKNY